VAARKESGTVTAELVLTLPAVLMVLVVAISAMTVQLTRMELVSSASSIARAIARGEPIEVVDALVMEAGSAVSFEIQELEGLICVVLKSEIKILDFDLPDFELIETQCAKPQGQ
jgi:Flp pilus assembly protein TadG